MASLRSAQNCRHSSCNGLVKRFLIELRELGGEGLQRHLGFSPRRDVHHAGDGSVIHALDIENRAHHRGDVDALPILADKLTFDLLFDAQPTTLKGGYGKRPALLTHV